MTHPAIRPALAATLALALAGPVSAEWRSAAGLGDAPYAIGEGSNDIALVLDCGNGGLPAISVEGHAATIPEELFVISVTGQPEELWGASCDGSSCLLDLESVERARRLIGQLRGGARVEIGLYRRGFISEMSLRGSARAIDRVTQACPI
ncbi:hypothetical protein [Roseicyclus mahoneyensis]|uniref:Invasion protein IalB n=1 Tax=Roseicyclus mahoneyensis TaxID=164332 RepID=A0A316GI33_9RHOB|nr:hypothetical protein [Roseicyclus mahoneyensis]PWK60726.1 hypothetical protein C7455_104364 [Roseicyclus mahoneyensis]